MPKFLRNTPFLEYDVYPGAVTLVSWFAQGAIVLAGCVDAMPQLRLSRRSLSRAPLADILVYRRQQSFENRPRNNGEKKGVRNNSRSKLKAKGQGLPSDRTVRCVPAFTSSPIMSSF